MHASRPPRRRTPCERGGRAFVRAGTVLFAAVVSLGLLVTQLARVGHMVIVSHAICEHGAVVHGHPAAVHHDAPHGQDATAVPGDAPDPPGHDHCDPFAVKSFAVSVGPSGVVPTLLDGELLPWSVRPRSGAQSIPILSLAPKSSPPV